MNRAQYDQAIQQALNEVVERLVPNGAGNVTEARLRSALDVMAQRVTTATRSYELLNMLDTEELSHAWDVSVRRVRAHVAMLHERHGIGREVHGRWLLTADEAERHKPGRAGHPGKRAE